MLNQKMLNQKKAFFDQMRSGFLVPDQKKSRFLISYFNSIKNGRSTPVAQ